MKGTDFDHDQFQEAYPPGIERTWWQVGRMAVIARTFERNVERTERVLEVGCGTGILTHHLRSRGWDVKGVELGAPRTGIHVPEHLFLGTDAMQLPEVFREGITVLALFDVIEHVPDASVFLHGLMNAFRNVHTVVITVPARQELWTSFDDHFGHYKRYDRPTLRADLTAAGLDTLRSAYFFHGLYPAIVLNNVLRGRKRNVRFVAPKPGLASTANRLIGRLFDLESRALPSTLPGSSLIAVAERA